MSRILIAAAIYHIACSVIIVAAPQLCIGLLGFEVHDLALLRGFGAVLGALGVGYGIAAMAPIRHWPIVLVGVTAKAIGSLLFLSAAFSGVIVWASTWPVATNGLAWIIPFSLILVSAARAYSHEEGAPPPSPRDRLLLRYVAQDGLTLYEHSLAHPLLTVFLRHTGCTFCREALADLSRLRPQIEGMGSRIALVAMSEEPEAAEAFARYGLSDVPRISDPTCELYRAFDLPRGSWPTMLSPKVWIRGLQAGVTGGHGVGTPQGDAFRMPGVFLIYQGMLVKSYRHASPADRPDYLSLAECSYCRPERFDRDLAVAQ